MGNDKRITVAILCFANLINYMDRYTVSGVLSDIEADLDLEHWQSGLLQTSFVIVYFVFAPLFGYLGDRYSRKWIMIAGLGLWATVSMTATLMPSYWPLLVMRALIGVGESGFTSVAPTVLTDFYAQEKRSAALAIFYLAIPLGSGLGYIVGSSVANAAGSWRWGLRVTPILAVVAMALMVLFLLDPERGQSEQGGTSKSGGRSLASYSEDLRYLMTNRSFVLSSLAGTCLSFFTGALSWWGPLYTENAILVAQEYGESSSIAPENSAFLFGLVLSVAGVLGLVTGSGLSYKLRDRFPRVDPVICGVGLLVSAPLCAWAIATAEDKIVGAIVTVFLGMSFLNTVWAIVVDIIMYVVIPTRRSSASAVHLVLTKALGEAFSPYIIGIMSDTIEKKLVGEETNNPHATSGAMTSLERDYYSMQYALYFCVALDVLGGIAFLAVAFFVLDDKAKAQQGFSEDDSIATESDSRVEEAEPNRET